MKIDTKYHIIMITITTLLIAGFALYVIVGVKALKFIISCLLRI